MNCASCKTAIERLELLRCSACSGCYHYRCLNVQSAVFREKSDELKRNVKCGDCSNVTRRIRTKDDMPVGVGATAAASFIPTAAVQGDGINSMPDAADVDLCVTSGAKFDLSMFVKVVNESVVERMALLEKKIISEIKAAFSAISKSENDRLRKELSETKEKCLALEVEVESMRKQANKVVKNPKNPPKQPAKKSPPLLTGDAETGTTPSTSSSCENSKTQTSSPVAALVVTTDVVPAPAPDTRPTKLSYAAAAMSTKIANREDHQEQAWIEVNANKKKLNPIKKGGNTSILQIKAVERKKYFHIWRLVSETTEEDLSQYVQEVLGKGNCLKVDKIRHKIEKRYASFRICVSEANFDKLCNPDIWPRDAEYSEWIWFRDPEYTKSQPQLSDAK